MKFNLECTCGTELTIRIKDILIDSFSNNPSPVVICGDCEKLIDVNTTLRDECNKNGVDYEGLLNKIKSSIINNIKDFKKSYEKPRSTLYRVRQSILKVIFSQDSSYINI